MHPLIGKIKDGGKDFLLGELGKYLLNKFGLEAYGQFTTLEIDTAQKHLSFSLLLKGEEQAVTGTIKYHLESDGADSLIVVDSAILSREWMNIVFERHFGPEKRRIPIPPRLQPIIKIAGL